MTTAKGPAGDPEAPKSLQFTAFLLACVLAAGNFVAAGELIVDVGRGPVTVHVPSSYDPMHPAPLVLLLHGYSGTGAIQESYFGLLPLAEQNGFIYAYPDGTTDATALQFWNATDACCDFFGSGVDDSGYLLDLVAEIRGELEIDPWRVHFVGHSNGGFMSYRMACDHADVVASIGSLAGATWFDPADCQPVGPVHTLQIHGTNDTTILYGGGSLNGTPYPGAVQTTETWANYDACDSTPDLSQPRRDLDAATPGAESSVRRYADGCTAAGSAELWTIPGGVHVPLLADGFRTGLIDFVLSHRKAGVSFSDPDTLNWPPLRWADSYRVYRGDLADLFDTDNDGLPDPGYGSCLGGVDPDPTDTTRSVTEVPPTGGGYFYLVGFVDELGEESPLGTNSAGAARRPAASCP